MIRSTRRLLPYQSYYMKKQTSGAFTFSTSRPHNTSVLLASAINSIYDQDWAARGVPPFRKDELINSIVVEKKYEIAQPLYYVFKRDSVPKLFLNMLDCESKRGVLWHKLSSDSQWSHVFIPGTPCDLLVLTALSRVLLSLTCHPPYIKNFHDYKYSHYHFLSRLQHVSRLYKLDLSESYYRVSKDYILKNIRLESGIDGLPFQLISSLFDQHFLNVCTDSSAPCREMPLLGDLSKVIFHIFLTNVFDKKMEKSYPGLTFYRLGHEVFIARKTNEIFDSKDAESLLKDLNLYGQIEFIVPEGGYLVGGEAEKYILIGPDCRVSVLNPENFTPEQRGIR